MKRLNMLTCCVQFLIGTDTLLVAPLLPLLTKRFGNTNAQAGWMVSAYAIGYCITAIFSGPMSDRFDRKHVLVAGMFGFSLATAACGFAWSLPSMMAMRFLAGLMAAIGSPQVWAAIPQLVPKNQVVRAMAAPTIGLTVAQLAGVPIASFLAAQSTALPFIVVGSFSLLLTLILSISFPHVRPEATYTHVAEQYARLMRTPHALQRFAAYFIFQIGNFAVMSFLATWFNRDFHVHTTGIGVVMIILGAGNTIGAIIGPRIVGRFGRWTVLKLAMAGYILTYLLLPLGRTIAIPVMILSFTFLIGGIIFPVFMSLLQSLTTTARGTVSALANVLMYLGSTIAGIIGGPLLSSLPGFWAISMLVVATSYTSYALWLGGSDK